MRISNRKKITRYHFLFTMVFIMQIIGCALYFLERHKFRALGQESILLILFPLFIIIVLVVRGRQIFEYDSDGEALNFNNYSIFKFGHKQSKDEFPKYKLIDFEIVNIGLIKKVYVTINSKKSKSLTLTYDISYLTRKELMDLNVSLSRVVETNKSLEVNNPEN